MYLLFRYKKIMPSVFFNSGYGEKKVIRAFFEREMEERYEETKGGED